MYRDDGIEYYNHIVTRLYLHLDSSGRCLTQSRDGRKEVILNKNGSASPDGREETLSAAEARQESVGVPARSSGKRHPSNRRSRRQTAEAFRYFVGKGSDPKPMLEQEVASEAEGLVVAFKTDGRLFRVQEFTVAQKIERERVSLKKQAAPVQRVSTTNAS